MRNENEDERAASIAPLADKQDEEGNETHGTTGQGRGQRSKDENGIAPPHDKHDEERAERWKRGKQANRHETSY